MSNEVPKELPKESPKEVSPSKSLVMNLRQQLMQVIPFSEMKPEHVDFFIKSAKEHYFAPEEIILEPIHGEVKQLFSFVRAVLFQDEAWPMKRVGRMRLRQVNYSL